MYQLLTSTPFSSLLFASFADARCDFGCKTLFSGAQHKDVDEEFLQRVTENTRRYVGIFAEAMDEIMPEPTEAYTVDEDRDILMTQRVDEGVDGGADGTDPLQRMPPDIKRFL
jgi:hypothetical protein